MGICDLDWRSGFVIGIPITNPDRQSKSPNPNPSSYSPIVVWALSPSQESAILLGSLLQPIQPDWPRVRTGHSGPAMSPPAAPYRFSRVHPMAVSIRLRRAGRKKAPMYRIVVADSRMPRDGKFIEVIGQYQPRTGEKAVALNTERANYWLDNGAQPSDTVRSLLRKAGVLKARHETRLAAKLSAAAVPVTETRE